MEENKLLINNDESYCFTLIKIEKDILKKVNNDKINAYYSLNDKRKNTNENVVILLSEADEIEKNYLRYVDEYHAAGYDL
ncbi:hypothetical protein L1K40_22895, partial [Escherichia coli]|nr:hypothetical protein [Escherichia coli]